MPIESFKPQTQIQPGPCGQGGARHSVAPARGRGRGCARRRPRTVGDVESNVSYCVETWGAWAGRHPVASRAMPQDSRPDRTRPDQTIPYHTMPYHQTRPDNTMPCHAMPCQTRPDQTMCHTMTPVILPSCYSTYATYYVMLPMLHTMLHAILCYIHPTYYATY